MFLGFLLSVIFLCGLIVIDSNVYAYEDLDSYYNSKLLSYGLSEAEINLMDIGLIEILIADFGEDIENNPDRKLNYYPGEIKEYIIDPDGNLVELPAIYNTSPNYVSPFNVIPTSDLKLQFSTANNGQKVQRIIALFEWTKKETAPREFVGFTKESKLNIVPNSYEARIMTRQQTYNTWQYYGNAGGRPYEIDANNGATWRWSGNAAYYKGHVSYKVDTKNKRTGIFQMQYASDPGGSNTSVNVSLGPLSINHTLSNNKAMLKAPHRATVVFRVGP